MTYSDWVDYCADHNFHPTELQDRFVKQVLESTCFNEFSSLGSGKTEILKRLEKSFHYFFSGKKRDYISEEILKLNDTQYTEDFDEVERNVKFVHD